MDLPWCYWIVAFAGIWMVNFGLYWTIIPILFFISFIFGIVVKLYNKNQDSLEHFEDNIYCDLNLKSGLRNVVEKMQFTNQCAKFDKRLTGSQKIDENLQDIIGNVLRDYVSPWYGRISSNDDFLTVVRQSLQSAVINISARIKDVSWTPYLTTRLVDDASSHLRLYRLACERSNTDSEFKKATPQSLASFKSATQAGSSGHSRNNSDGGNKITTPKTHSRNSSFSEKLLDLETAFFRIESEQENNRLTHDSLCRNREVERQYLNDVVDVVLYLLFSPSDFQCLPARNLLREIIIGGILLPLIDMLSEPDYINLCFVRLCKDVVITSEAFLATIRATSSKEELDALLELVNKEILMLRSRDSGGEGEAQIRQQLNSLLYVKKAIDTRLMGGLQKTLSTNVTQLMQLPLTVILKNNVALSYFIDYLSTIDLQNYIFLHLNMESWKASVQSERQRHEIGDKTINDNLRDAAISISQQYFSEESQSRVKLDARIEEQLILKISRESINELWFDELADILKKKLKSKYLPEFYKSHIYIKLLSDLELLKDMEQEDESQSPDTLSLTDATEDDEPLDKKREPISGSGKFQLLVEITDSGVVQDRGKTYGIYALSVTRIYENGFSEKWQVYRRYSDFYDLQQKIKETYSDLGKLPFPGKKAFNNMGALTLSKRMKMLNDYLQILLHSGVAETHPRLSSYLLAFLEPVEYDKPGTLSSAIESVMSPIKSSMRSVGAAVRTVPDNLFHTVDGLSRSWQPSRKDAFREPSENVPLRIMLLLMDEVFDLQSRNQWLRRRIVTLLRQMFGDIMNKKILDYFEELTGAERVSDYLARIKEALWPNGVRAGTSAERDAATRLRTKVAAKTALLSALSDDFKHLLGSDTTRRGLLRVYNTFQHPLLNRRLVYILLEGILEQIFPPIIDIHSKLSRFKQRKCL